MKTNKPDSPPVRRELLHQGAKFNYERLTFATRGGQEISRECVRHPGAVIILPLLGPVGKRSVVLIRNWRVSVEDWMWELPAGTLGAGEDPRVCAGRELEEETGYSAAGIEPIISFRTSPGLSDELMHAFVATGLRANEQRLEPDERISVHPTPIQECMTLIDSGELTDAKSILVLEHAARRGLL